MKSSPRANVRHTLVLLDSLRLVVQLEGATRGRNTRARRAVAYARWYCGSGCHTVARVLDARSQLAAASAQPVAVTTRRVRVTRFSNVLACLRKKSTEAEPKGCFGHGVLKGYQVTIQNCKFTA